MIILKLTLLDIVTVQSTGNIEYANGISVEGKTLPQQETKQSDGEAPVLELWGM